MSIYLFFFVAFALLMSLVRELRKRGMDSIPVAVWKYFSYYTTLSNLLVLVWFATLSFDVSQQISQFAANANVAAAITFYITTVGLANYMIYGWQNLSLFERICDLLVHALTPLITLLYWLIFVSKHQLEFSAIGYWLIFPLTYAIYTMLHGKWTQFYPYEFTDIQTLGFNKVLLNALALSVSLIVCGLLFIALGKSVGQF